MITQILSNTTPDTFDGVISTIDISLIKPPIEARESICVCDCDYEELSFYKSGGETWENDSSTVLAEVFLTTDSNSFKLYKEGVLKATITNNTYGTYIAVGGYATQPLKTSFKADWLLISTAFGNGLYTIKSDATILNQNLITETHKYRVTGYTNEKAKGTVVIKTIQNGIIEGGIDYIGLDFEQSIRIRGNISGAKRSLETDRYLSQKLTLEQIQEKVIKNYSLETGLIPNDIASPFLDDKVMANSIKITNYGFYEFETHVDLEVVLEDFTDSIYFAKNKNGVFILDFTARVQDLRKRNFI